jgi:2-phosphosulfolactate phosphatase
MPARTSFERGPEGARRGADRGDVVVVIDTLSFSSLVATAIHHGSAIVPAGPGEDPVAIALELDAVAARPRREIDEDHPLSLSPVPYQFLEPGTVVVVLSPNGAACTAAAAGAPVILAGCLLNAAATADAVERADRPATLVACGEIRRDGSRRRAEEDDLGAGAILSALNRRLTGEAREVTEEFEMVRGSLGHALTACESGRELREAGFSEDVFHAARLNRYDSVPVLDPTGRPCFRRG